MSYSQIFGRSLRALFLVATIAALPLATQAATLTYGPTAYGPFTAGSPSGNFNVPQFDPSFGTLISVSLHIAGHSDGGYNKVENLSENAGNASADIGTNITVSGPAALTVLTIPLNSASGPIAAFDGTLDWAASPDLLAVFGLPSSDSNSNFITVGMGPYIGLGNVLFSYSSTANTSSSADVAPTASLTSAPTFDFEATVTYEYNLVPEPGTLALLGVGLAGLGLVVRRKRSA